MNREKLVSLLELVSPALANNNLVPVYTNYVFHKGTIAAYNDSLAITAKAEEVGSFAISNSLLGLLKNSEAEEVAFQVKENEVVVSCGKSRFKLPYFGEDEFIFASPEGKPSFKMQLGEYELGAISTCLVTASSDFALPALMGVCLNSEKAAFYSCDGDAITQVDWAGKPPGEVTCMLTTTFCTALKKTWETTEQTKGTLNIYTDWAVATLSGVSVYGRIIENSNPLNHDQLIKETLGKKATYVENPVGLAEALMRARVVADPESAKTVLTVKGSKLKLLTETASGEVIDEIPIKGHPDVEAAVHASLVHRSVERCSHIAILPNATTYKAGEHTVMVVSNIGI